MGRSLIEKVGRKEKFVEKRFFSCMANFEWRHISKSQKISTETREKLKLNFFDENY